MGGYFSGRHRRDASKLSEFRRIDLADLKRWGALEPGRSGTLSWSIAGRSLGRVRYTVQTDALVLHYAFTRDGEQTTITDRLPFTRTSQHLGGERVWFACPSCGSRRRVLFGGRRFRCRACYGATYDSQYDALRLPGLTRAQRIRERFGGEPGLAHPFPPKPKGMHWRTYRRLEAQDDAILMGFEWMA